MKREEQINKAWELAFKNIVESIGTERTREEVACIFFELGCRWADENNSVDWQQVRTQAAIAAMQGMLSNDCSVHSAMDMSEKVHRLPSDVLATMAVSQADALIEELKGE